MSSVAEAWFSATFLIPSSLLASMGSSLFSSIFISQASLSPMLEEGDDMMPSLENPDRKQLGTRTEDNCVIRESKPSGEYIMNFYRPKYVSCKETESGRHTRCSRGRGRAQGGRARPPPSCPSRTATYFSIFLNIPKRRNIALQIVLESVHLPYHIPIPFRSLKRSGKCL